MKTITESNYFVKKATFYFLTLRNMLTFLGKYGLSEKLFFNCGYVLRLDYLYITIKTISRLGNCISIGIYIYIYIVLTFGRKYSE